MIFNIICLCFLMAGVFLLSCDLFILKRIKVEKTALSDLKEWCQSQGTNPDDFLKIIKKYENLKKEGTK